MTNDTTLRSDDPYDLIGQLNDGTYRVYRREGYRIWLNVSESRQMAKRAVGKYEPEKFRALADLLKPGMVVMDIGANKGDFTLFAAACVGGTGRVMAFEPHPDNVAWLRKSVALNAFEQVEIIQAALAEEAGRADLHLGPKSGHHSLDVLRRDRGAIPVDLVTLDGIWTAQGKPDIAVIKVDVEGAEDRVIAGGMAALTACRPVILIDIHAIGEPRMTALTNTLATLGYAIVDLATGSPAALSSDRDFILTPQ